MGARDVEGARAVVGSDAELGSLVPEEGSRVDGCGARAVFADPEMSAAFFHSTEAVRHAEPTDESAAIIDHHIA